MDDRIGEILVRAGKVRPNQVTEGLETQREKGGRLGSILVQSGYLNEDELIETLAEHFGVASIDLEDIEIDEDVIRVVPAELARKYTILPLSRAAARITLAMMDPTNVFALDDIKFMTGYSVEPVLASEEALRTAIDRFYGTSHAVELKRVMDEFDGESIEDMELLDDAEEIALADLEEASEDAPVVRLVNMILFDAIKRGASDIHVEPYEKEYRVRYRIDGILYHVMNPPLKLKEAVTSRIKIMAKLDIAEKRLPQDGRIRIKAKIDNKPKDLDLRVSVLPTLFGEKIVMRLLDKDNLMLDMTQLGFEPDSLRRFENGINKPYGMILVTGPTGSGKTNTLYSALSKLNTGEVNIITAEDPVEFNLPGVNQVQMKESIGLNFAAALRSFLRQDPNVILVGEIRDFETAEVAIKAAMTGHLVLSTLHTNDAPSSVNRLMNMGIEPFLVATTLHLVVAQRLIRRICVACKTEVDAPPGTLESLGLDSTDLQGVTLYHGIGCDRCNQTGYKGRLGLFEVMEVEDEIRDLVIGGGSSSELRAKSIQNGMISLRASGLQKIRDGMTTVEEVVRETVMH